MTNENRFDGLKRIPSRREVEQTSDKKGGC
jgi:hypothetical protein